MNTILSAACFSVVLAIASAHMCLISPHQRGSMMDLNKKGSNDCILLNSPCGGRPLAKPMITLMAGSNASIIVQKNLDHWAQATPGYFAVSLMQGSITTQIGRVPDMGEASLTLYTIMGMVPATMTGQAVLQATYVTMNPQAPAVFYQCADVTIM
ncbi:uncharacterized protein LOC132720748 [Ruditapes philippinarum]|uniref:uncharacterized protein LOC132720748 n=1 Tax=Ruditapes philippinarum TaxID=129788 RepID=UPI00295B0B9B|nr:uncharacterized protein LOC132720748 [Ruditapes philippinarum]